MSVTPYNIFFKALHPGLSLPTKGSDLAAGWDLRACILDNEGRPSYTTMWPQSRLLVKCGFTVWMPDDFEMQVRPRSGLALKHGVTVLNSPGTIDADYRGEVAVILHNTDSQNKFRIDHGDRIAQAVFSRVIPITWSEMGPYMDMPETKRGGGGYGSSGVR